MAASRCSDSRSARVPRNCPPSKIGIEIDGKTALRYTQLHVTLRELSDRHERDAVSVLFRRQGIPVGCFHSPPHAAEKIELPMT
jgi:hypothetical protein